MTATTLELPPALAGREPPREDPQQLRAAAARLDAAALRYEEAARRLRTRTTGLTTSWRGTAAAPAHDDLADLQARTSHAAEAHAAAAQALLSCAARLEDAVATWQRAEALERQDALERATATIPVLHDSSPLRQQARRLADQAEAEAAEAVARAAERLRGLAAPTAGQKSLRALDQLRGFGRGAVDAVWGSVVTAAALSLPRMLADRRGWVEQVRGVRDGAAYAAGHPREAGKAALGWELLRDGRYGEWSGALLPDLLGAVVSGGGIPIARRGADLADDLSELAEDVDDLQRVHRVVDVNAGGPVERRPGADLPVDYVDHIQDLTPERRKHILHGDDRGGGHRPGAGRGVKSEFPADWSDDLIIQRVMETARSPEAGFWNSNHKSFNVTRTFDGVEVMVAVNRQGEVRTGYPLLRARRPGSTR